MDETTAKLVSSKATVASLIDVQKTILQDYAEIHASYKEYFMRQGLSGAYLVKAIELHTSYDVLKLVSQKISHAIDIGIAELQSVSQTRH